MPIVNCPKCGKLFSNDIRPICDLCFKEEEEMFDKVRDFIKSNDSCTMAQVSEETGVSAKKIIKYIKEGRIEISKGMSGEIKCEACDKPISTGKYCEMCAKKISDEVMEAFGKQQAPIKKATQSSSAKMHLSKRGTTL